MKKLSAALAVVVLLLCAVPILADQVVPVWADNGTNASTTVNTQGYKTAQVTIWASTGSPDGTVTISYVPPGGGPWVTLKTYATPTTAKTFAGPAGSTLGLALTGNTTGKVSVTVVLK